MWSIEVFRGFMQTIQAQWTRNRVTILVLIVAVIGLPVLAAINVPSRPVVTTATPAPRYSGVKLPPNYRADFVHYATIQRPDGTIRDIYVNADTLVGLDQGYLLPDNATIVIEGYFAQKDASGAFVLDADGHYIPDKPMDMIHVREKRRDWLPGDFVSEARNGDWNYGSFDTQSGAPFDESISACFNCHHASEQPDFLYSYPQMIRYAVTGETVYFICNLTGRSAC
jgi:Cytochrome P460